MWSNIEAEARGLIRTVPINYTIIILIASSFQSSYLSCDSRKKYLLYYGGLREKNTNGIDYSLTKIVSIIRCGKGYKTIRLLPKFRDRYNERANAQSENDRTDEHRANGITIFFPWRTKGETVQYSRYADEKSLGFFCRRSTECSIGFRNIFASSSTPTKRTTVMADGENEPNAA